MGTRPEIIRLSRVVAALDRYTDHKVIHTGQNYDYELNQIFYDDLGIRPPDRFLNAAGKTLGATLGKILSESETALAEMKPDAVLILGDTNSAIAGIMARRMKIPLFHMEAGNRSFDPNVPEEVNRKIIDHVSDFNLVYTEHARRHLLSEGLPHRRVNVVGSPMREVLDFYRPRIQASTILKQLKLTKQRYFIVSLHREENVDSKANLQALISALNGIAARYEMPVVISTHPRTRNRIEKLGGAEPNPLLRFLKPFGFTDYCNLQLNALCTISDSGTIAEESSILNFPAITPRVAIERPEAIDTGSIIVTGHNPDIILQAIETIVAQRKDRPATMPADYAITNTSERVVNLILGAAKLTHIWDNLRRHDYDLNSSEN